MPTEFLYSDPEMLRQYGERILIFNMHDPATREAFAKARETVNGYVLVSEPVSTDVIEGVFDLEAGAWEFPWGPKCRPGIAAASFLLGAWPDPIWQVNQVDPVWDRPWLDLSSSVRSDRPRRQQFQ